MTDTCTTPAPIRNTTTMDIDAPPSLMLPQISFSAPQSRRPSAPPTPIGARRPRAFSQPTSPVATRPTSPIAKRAPQPPIRSPSHGIRRHRYHVSFGKDDTRGRIKSAPCPAHAYATVEQEIAAMPNKALSNAAVKFGDTPRDTVHLRANCPVHVYSEARSTLKRMGTAPMARFDERKEEPDVCPVHAYESPATTLKQAPQTFAKYSAPRQAAAATAGPQVHSYEEPRSTLAHTGAASFSRDAARLSDRRALAPVHSYSSTYSSLKRTGGTMATSSRSGWLHSLSRTGLVPATSHSPRSSLPPAGGAMPKLKPLPKIRVVEEVEDAQHASPREIEAPIQEVVHAAAAA